MIILPTTRTTTRKAIGQMSSRKAGLDQHADGDEEERREEVADRDDLGQHLAVELRLGDDQTRPGRRRGPATAPPRGWRGRAEGDQDDGQQKQLARPGPGDDVEDPRHEARAEHDDRDERDRRRPQRADQADDQVIARRRAAAAAPASAPGSGPGRRPGRARPWPGGSPPRRGRAAT